MAKRRTVASFDDITTAGDYVVKDPKTAPIEVVDVKRPLCTSAEYIVYVDNVDAINYLLHPSVKAPGPRFGGIWNRVLELSFQPRINLSGPERETFLAILGTSISFGLEGDYKNAKVALTQADTLLIDRSARRSKLHYTSGALVAGLVFVVAGAIWLSIGGEDNGASIGTGTIDKSASTAWQLIAGCSLLGGGAGALLSALANRGPLPSFDPFSRARLSAWSGALRIIYGSLGAFVVLLAIKIGWVTSDLISEQNEAFVLTFFACIGGFSERWAPEIIRSVGRSVPPESGQT